MFGMDSETSALRRTAFLLLALSVFRWAWTRPGAEPLGAVEADLPMLIDSSRAGEADAEARSRPLGPEERVDPNTANEVDLDRLPGIGPSTAAAIVAERARSGPFDGPDDLTRVSGIGVSTIAKIRRHLAASEGPRSRAPPRARAGIGNASGQIDVNQADQRQLAILPGVGPALAARIIEARQQQPFTSLDDLVRVRGIGPATVEGLRALARVR